MDRCRENESAAAKWGPGWGLPVGEFKQFPVSSMEIGHQTGEKSVRVRERALWAGRNSFP